MSEPRRLLEDEQSSDLERALLRSWNTEQPPPGARGRVLALAGLATAATAATATAAGTATAAASTTATAAAGGSIAPKAAGVGVLALTKWLAVGAVALTATTTTVVVVRHETRAPVATAPASRPTPIAAPAPLAPKPAPSPDSQDALQNKPFAPTAPDPTPAPNAPNGTGRAAAARPATTSLADQTSAMDRARSALADGDPSRAMRLVDEYQARYPSGAFQQEAEVLRIEALVRRGDRDAASRAGARFLSAHPQSPHAAHVRALLGGSSP